MSFAAPGVPFYQSKNNKHHWSRANYIYYVGQRVLWPEGTNGGIPYGVWGTVTELPSKDHPYLTAKLDDREEPSEFYGGSDLIPRRKVIEDTKNLRYKQYKAARDLLKQLDYLGNDV